MTTESAKKIELESNLNSRLASAREERSRFAPTYNNYYELSSPGKLRVNDERNQSRPPDDQDDVFDATLQEVSENFAADMADEFTPSYRQWTKHEAVDSVAPEFKQQVDEYITGRMDFLYDGIRRSSYEEASQECYHDMGIGPWAMMIRHSQTGPVDCEYVPLAQLLLGPGPKGGTGMRAWERDVEERYLHVIWPDVDWPKILGKNERDIREGKNRTPLKVVEMYVRDYDANEETWDYYLMVKSKIVDQARQSGLGSSPLIAARIRVSAPGAYGLGPANKALPAARTLNELSYLELKRIGKIVDPPGVFSDPSGLFNPEQGFGAGQFYEAGDGFVIQDLAPQTDVREAFFKKNEMIETVRRAMFQDHPQQLGLTPPSATQILSETAVREKRKTLPRARVHDEWVLELIRRFEWIFMRRGELEPLVVDGKAIRIQPRSPLSRASDLEEVQISAQAMGIYNANFPEEFAANLDANETMRKIGEKIGDRLTTVLDPEVAQARQAAQAAQASGEIAQ